MSALVRDFKILKIPAKQLSTRCEAVTFPLSQETIDDIYYLKTCFRKNFGNDQIRVLGLSAPQVGIMKRFFVVPQHIGWVSKSPLSLRGSNIRNIECIINPHIEISSDSNQLTQAPQLCLSVPGEPVNVDRPDIIFVRYYNMEGKMKDEWLGGIKARVLQHETEHLNGLTIDRFMVRMRNITRNKKNDKN